MPKDIKMLLKNLCCSRCKSEFDEDSIGSVKNGLNVINLKCNKCGKDFGLGLLNINQSRNTVPLEIQEGPEPINYDDVIDAHKFIKNMDKDWQNYIPKSE